MLTELDATHSEGDVETQIVVPLLTNTGLLGIDRTLLRSKEHLRPIDVGKGESKTRGYYPDFSVYINALPICIVEAKSPANNVEQGYREAALYALEFNKHFPAQTNPCQVLISTNGTEVHAGNWDGKAALKCKVSELVAGSPQLLQLQELAGMSILQSQADAISISLRSKDFKRPFNQGEGPTLINSKVGNNSFAAELAPILRKYFTSHGQQEDREIWERAYISSKEVTTYDKALESYLKERISTAKSVGKKLLSPTKSRERTVESAIRRYDSDRPADGAMQIITGSVGAGKSLFVRRYKELLQPREIAKKCHWAFINLNNAPPRLENLREWVCQKFVESVQEEGAPVSLVDAEMQERIFSTNLHARKAYYDRMNSVGQRKGDLEAARDIEQWRQNPETSATAIARYLHGDRGENLVVVFDNVDRRSASEQLVCFQLAQWFMAETRCLAILSMRDVTFELHKNEPPLDTFKSGTIFHISPPRFIDVVKKRLELSLEALDKEVTGQVKFNISSGAQMVYDAKNASSFLRSVYEEIFERPRNISKIIEALAARNVRQSLDMFLTILTSGHMREDHLTQMAMKPQDFRLSEYTLIKILMRGDSRFFSDSSGMIANIFHCDGQWKRPSNLLCGEILYWLIGKRKAPGDNGHMGYFSVSTICAIMEKMGFVPPDVIAACKYLMGKALIEADTLSLIELAPEDCIKVTASGFIHMRILSERVEYISSVLPTTAIDDRAFSDRVFDAMGIENRMGKITLARRLNLASQLAAYLANQRNLMRQHDGYRSLTKTGADYLIGHIEAAVKKFSNDGQKQRPSQLDFLDTL